MIDIIALLVACISLLVSFIAIIISYKQTKYERRLESYLFITNLKNQIESVDTSLHSASYYLKVYLCLNCLSNINTGQWYSLLKENNDKSAKYQFLNSLEPIKKHKYLYNAIWPKSLSNGRVLISVFEKKLEELLNLLIIKGDSKEVQEKIRENHMKLLEICSSIDKSKYERILNF